MKSTFGIAAVAVMGMFAGQASAATLVADGFDQYADGQLTGSLPASNSPVNVGGGLWIAHSGATFGDNVDVLGGSAILNNSGSEDVHRDANDDGGTTTNGGTDTWYYAVKFTVTDKDLANDFVNQDYFAHFWGPSFAFRGRAYIANPSVTAGKFAIGLSATSGGLVTKTADIDYDVEHVIVVSFDAATGVSKLWLNPTTSADPFITDTGAAGSVLQAVALRQDFISGGAGNPPIADNEIAVNGIALATTWNEAFAGSMVPEPASLGLIALGGLAMLRRRTA